jgi:hypothetical protein
MNECRHIVGPYSKALLDQYHADHVFKTEDRRMSEWMESTLRVHHSIDYHEALWALRARDKDSEEAEG